MLRALLAASLALLVTAPARSDDREPWFAAKVTVSRPDRSNVGSGSPVACEKGKALIVTNAHVVRPTDKDAELTVTLAGKSYRAKYVGGSGVKDIAPGRIETDGPDLALLEIDAECGWVTFADAEPKEGTTVAQWGYGGTFDGRPVLRSGKVKAGPPVGHQWSSGVSVPGDSGAGVFDAATGKLVGVRWGGSEAGDSVAVPLAAVKKFVAETAPANRFPKLRERLDAAKDKLNPNAGK